jgi:hypothetical protein
VSGEAPVAALSRAVPPGLTVIVICLRFARVIVRAQLYYRGSYENNVQKHSAGTACMWVPTAYTHTINKLKF